MSGTALLLDTIIKTALIVLLALAASVVLRRQSAALRHWMLAAAIVCAAATPLFTIVVPSWNLPRVEPPSGGLTLAADADLGSASSGTAVATRGSQAAGSRVLMQRLIAIWIAGSTIGLSVLLIGLARLAWIAAKARPVCEGVWRDLANEVAQQHGLRRPVLLLQSDHPTLLVTWGLIRPKVILPRAAREWSGDRARIVLCHELAHIRRRDWVIQVAAQIVRSAYWFNPLVWMACTRLRLESEQACDDRVLNLGVERTEYATQLLDLARTFRKHGGSLSLGSPAPAIAHPSSLERRIRAMLNARLNRAPLSRSTCAVIAAALLTLTASIAGFGAAAQSGAATFSGSLMDAIGRVLADAPIVLEHAQSGEKHETRSDPSGHFQLAGLPAGDYQLKTRLMGFASEQGRVALKAGQNLQQDVVLQVGSISETIVIGTPSVPRISESGQKATPSQVDRCSQSAAAGCIDPPRKIRDVKPRYPPHLWEAGTGGLVKVEGRIGTDGFVKDLRVLAPADPDLASALLDAVRQWQFTATRLDGVPIEVRVDINARFSPQQ